MIFALSQDGAEDDDVWMTGGAADLEAELAKRQKELGDNVAKHAKRTAQGLGDPEAAPEFDPTQMVSKMKVWHPLVKAINRFMASACLTVLLQMSLVWGAIRTCAA